MSNLIDQLRETAWARSSKLEMEAADRIAELEREVQHWKANHDNMVAKNALLSQRPDLPADRIPAMRKLDELERQNAELRQQLAAADKTAATVQWIVMGYGETDSPEFKTASTKEQAFDALIGMIFDPASAMPADERQQWKENFDDPDNWSLNGKRWETTFEIGGIEVTEVYGAAPQPQAAPEDSRDAARYQQIRRGQKWSVINGIGDVLRGDALDSAIDAALAQAGKEQSNG